MIMGLPPLGCVPAQITLHGKPGDKTCVKTLNDDASTMNKQIISLIEDMKHQTPGARLVYVDIFGPIYNAFQDPQKYGTNCSILRRFTHLAPSPVMHILISSRSFGTVNFSQVDAAPS